MNHIRSLKKILHQVLYTSGGYNGIHWLTRYYVPVLVYHRFGPGEGNAKHLGANILSRQLHLIKKKCNPVTLDKLYRAAAGECALQKRAVVITIDDGYEDFYQYALPVFKQFQIPATLFVVSDFIDQKIWLWPDQLAYIMENTEKPDYTATSYGKETKKYNLMTPGDRHRAWNDVADEALSLPDPDCRRFIKRLSNDLKVDIPEYPTQPYRAMTWDQVRFAQKNGITIGSHTCTHPRLTHVDPLQLNDELIRSKQKIENELNHPVLSFCYPFGRKADIDMSVKSAVASAGYQNATIGYYNLAVTNDPYEIKRLGTGADMDDFVKKVMGWETLKTFLTNRQFDR